MLLHATHYRLLDSLCLEFTTVQISVLPFQNIKIWTMWTMLPQASLASLFWQSTVQRIVRKQKLWCEVVIVFVKFLVELQIIYEVAYDKDF